ncbi:hypothetical protein CDAR_441591 [Caerostris darwini]|uniref:Secreted protein n=1 Tax=Caerostris darwini TaxID=1538125 RepID=A0AAV4QUC3_9ARAC|nr:hypothetical protein CDAR_441591 [Caerostris darwini]
MHRISPKRRTLFLCTFFHREKKKRGLSLTEEIHIFFFFSFPTATRAGCAFWQGGKTQSRGFRVQSFRGSRFRRFHFSEADRETTRASGIDRFWGACTALCREAREPTTPLNKLSTQRNVLNT